MHFCNLRWAATAFAALRPALPTGCLRPASELQTILNPTAADDYAARNRRGGGGSGGGGPPRPPRGPRITGLGDLRDASGGEVCLTRPLTPLPAQLRGSG